MALTDFQTRKAANPNAIGIINLSWTVWSKKAVEDAIAAAIAEGMHFVITAGNDFENQVSVSSDSIKASILKGRHSATNVLRISVSSLLEVSIMRTRMRLTGDL